MTARLATQPVYVYNRLGSVSYERGELLTITDSNTTP